MTKHWFTIKVRYVRHDSEGAEVKATETFVLDAYNYTEAETRMTLICENEGIRPFEILSISKTALAEVIRFEDADLWFKVKISLTILDEQKGAEKETSQHILLSAKDVRDAYDKVCNHMNRLGIGYVIPAVTYQKITEVFPLDEEQGGHHVTPLTQHHAVPAGDRDLDTEESPFLDD